MSSSLSLEMTTVGGAVGGLAPQNGTLRGIGKVWLEGIYWICVNNAWTSYIAVRVTHAVMPSYPESIVLQRSLANKQKPMLHGNNGNWDDVVKDLFLYSSFLAIQYVRCWSTSKVTDKTIESPHTRLVVRAMLPVDWTARASRRRRRSTAQYGARVWN